MDTVLIKLLVLVLLLANIVVGIAPTLTYSVETKLAVGKAGLPGTGSHIPELYIIKYNTAKVYGSPLKPPQPRTKPFNYMDALAKAARIDDRDGDRINDALAKALETGKIPSNYVYDNSSNRIAVLIVLNASVARNHSQAVNLRSMVKGLMDYITQRFPDVKIRYGPFLYSLVGFSAWVPGNISYLKRIVDSLNSLSINGGEYPSIGVMVVEPVVYYKLMSNYMTTKALCVRPKIWTGLGIDGDNITVAVSDTGVDGSHAAFKWPSYKIVYWYDYINGQSTPYDDIGHGTHVSGTILGAYNVSSAGVPGYMGVRSDYSYYSGYVMSWYVNTTGKWLNVSTNTGTITLYYHGELPWWLAKRTGNYTSLGSGSSINITVNKTGWYSIVESTFLWSATPVMKVPVENPGDGYPYMSGIAPKANLVMFKVCSSNGCPNDAIDASINESISIRKNYGIKVHNFSLGGSYNATEDVFFSNLAQSGIVLVVAAGNDGPGKNYAGTSSPASNIYAITVAASDEFPFNITSYSSEGGPSSSDSSVIKPDVTCVGGGAPWNNITEQVFSAASAQAFSGYDNWTIGMAGTSMATPCVSGVAALVAQAYINATGSWNYSSFSSVEMVKNIILMTAYETYPLKRIANATYSPTLDKGGKDVHEGYGAVDPYAAVQAALSLKNPLMPGTVVEGWFRRGAVYAGTVTNEFGPSVWAKLFYLPYRTVTLPNGTSFTVKYKFKLYLNTTDPANTDFDLYLYNYTGNTTNGEPRIIANSTGGFNTNESITYTPATDKEYLWVVAKRAREDSAGGNWVLVTSPSISEYGQPEGGSVPSESGEAWIGWPIEINGTASKDVSRIVIEIWASNGTRLATLDSANGEVTIVDPVYYTYYEANYTIPYDTNLVGQNLTIITYFYDSTGTLTEGPVYTTATVNSATAPIPEPHWIPIVVVVVVLSIAYVFLRRK